MPATRRPSLGIHTDLFKVFTKFVTFTVLIFAFSNSRANIFDRDSRQRVGNPNLPWSAIGRLNLPDGAHCTATLVSRDLVLTAAHCVTEDDGNIIKGNYVFIPGLGINDKKFGRSAGVELFWVGHDSAKNRGQDWAILKLDTPLGDFYGWLGVQSLPTKSLRNLNDVFMASYSHDLQQGKFMTWERGCRIRGIYSTNPGLVVTHDCSGNVGSSGAPIFYFQDENDALTANIVALQSGGCTETQEGEIGIPFSPQFPNLAVPAANFFKKLKEIRNRE